jgi:DNA-binding protein H-NS
MSDISHLSEEELAELISNASKQLSQKQQQKRSETIAEIKQLAASIGVSIELVDAGQKASARKGSKVSIKYRDPANSSNAWTGRGMKPRWLANYLEEGRAIEEFLI